MTAGPGPLIYKRDGCHRLHPEEIGNDDQRQVWTWDHCHEDLIALLVREDAERKYAEGGQERKEPEEANDRPTDLVDEPLQRKQQELS
jgi:hypothetical protein